jgi:hypothetical protein
MVSTIPQVGVLEEIFITRTGDIANGRHRWRGAILAGLATKECLPYQVIDEEAVDSAILIALSARKNYSRSAVAYLARPHIEAALLHKKGQVTRNLPSQKGINTLLGAKGSGQTLAEVAAMLNVSVETLKLASTTVRLFADSDKRRNTWLAAHPEEATAWQEYQDITGTESRWQTWRDSRLADMGKALSDRKNAVIIPEDYREVYEAKLFSVEPGESMGLGAINKAVGSCLATAGQPRSDLDTDTNPGLHLTLAKKLESFGKTMWAEKTWSTLELDHRLELAVKIAETLATAPEEVRNAVASKLLKKR